MNTLTQTDLSSRNTFLMEHLNGPANRMLRNLAYHFHVEYEDLYQEAAVRLLEEYDRIQGKEDPIAYAQTTIRHTFLKKFDRHHLQIQTTDRATLSLDLPISDDSTYADLVPEPDPAPRDITHEDRRIEALYAALGRLPVEEQMYLCRVHGLNAYTPVPPTEGQWAFQSPDFTRSDDAVGMHAYTWLRRDQALAQTICGDTGKESIPVSKCQQLDEAYARLQAQGKKKISINTLCREAHMGNEIVALYLRKREPERSQTLEQRLAEACTRLLTLGKKLTGNALAQEAHVRPPTARAYLQGRQDANSH